MKYLLNLPVKIKLIIIFSVFLFITVIGLIGQKLIQNQKKELLTVNHEITNIAKDVSYILLEQNRFLLAGSIDTNFFKTAQTQHLLKRDSADCALHEHLQELKTHGQIKENSHLLKQLNVLQVDIENLSSLLSKITEIMFLRGYKHFGIVGKMRVNAHILEDVYDHMIAKEDILMLRRHEKDFILRKEAKYVDKFNDKYMEVNQQLEHKNTEAIRILDRYHYYFHQLIACEKSIGYGNSEGLRSELDILNRKIQNSVNSLVADISVISLAKEKRMDQLWIVLFAVYIIIMILVSLYLAEKLTWRLRYLSESIKLFVDSDFRRTTSFSQKIGKDEIGNLARNFKVLEDEISVHFRSFRTNAIKKEKEITRKNIVLNRANTLIKQQNKDMLDSIRYAKRIQHAILPSETWLKRILPDHFLIYKPKDIVSGDFYWVEQIGNKQFIAVADCTGHGVPGAFMSLLGYNFLNQAIKQKKLTDPGEILYYLNVAISSSFNKNHEKERMRDGMDIALLVVDRKNNKVIYAGAQRPILVVRDNEILEVRGHRMPIGGFVTQQDVHYPTQEISVSGGDLLYMYTDGYTDQFGGHDDYVLTKKFKTSQFKKLINSIKHEDMMLQGQLIEEAYELWRGKHDQIDDICVLGIRIM